MYTFAISDLVGALRRIIALRGAIDMLRNPFLKSMFVIRMTSESMHTLFTSNYEVLST